MTLKLEKSVEALPHQIKSLYLARTTPGAVRKNWFDRGVDPLKVPSSNIEFRFDYQLINKVEVLMGFELSADGEILLNKPKWRLLTEDFYNASVGEAILCRHVRYENTQLGVFRDYELELPNYDQCFILVPPSLAPKPTFPSLPQGPTFDILNIGVRVAPGEFAAKAENKLAPSLATLTATSTNPILKFAEFPETEQTAGRRRI